MCAGNEFRLPVYSTSRTVVFTPNSEGTKRVLLEKTTVSESEPALVRVFVWWWAARLNTFITAGEGPTVRVDQR